MFSQRLKELRIEKGIGQKEIANFLNITRSGYSNYEQGTREPSLELLKLICDFFDVSADYLIGRSDNY